MKKLICIILLFSVFLFISACGKNSSDTINDTSTNKFDLGQNVNRNVKASLSSSEQADKKLTAYAPHEEAIVDGVNHIIEIGDSRLRQEHKSAIDKDNSKIFLALFQLIRDNTLPALTETLAELFGIVALDHESMKAVSDFLNTRTGVDFKNLIELVRRILNYTPAQKKENALWLAICKVFNSHPQLLKNLFALLSDTLIKLEPQSSAKVLQFLSQSVLISRDDDLGKPVWLARLDRNDNPLVLKDGELIFAPFVDDGTGVCKVNARKQPIDAQGNVLEIPAFSDKEYKDEDGNVLIKRDSQGRALSIDDRLIFKYYDAKKTVFGVMLYKAGLAIDKDILRDIYKFAAVALLPTKQHCDQFGNYTGYSDQSDLAVGAAKVIELLKQKDIRDFINGLSVIIADKRFTLEQKMQAFGGLGVVAFKHLRDNQDINDIDSLKVWFNSLGNNPPQEIFPLLQIMSQVTIPGSNYPNMAMLFFTLVGQQGQELSEGLWPLIKMLRTVKAHYLKENPMFEEMLLQKLLHWLQWTFVYEIYVINPQTQQPIRMPIASILLNSFTADMAINTEAKIKYIQATLKGLVTSRGLYLFMTCFGQIARTEEYKVLRQAIVDFLSPKFDIYDELVRVGIGMIECSNKIEVKIRLLNIIGKLLDPKLPIIINLLDSLGRLIAVDNELVFLNILRATFSKCPEHQATPIILFNRAYIAVLRASSNIIDKEITPTDVKQLVLGLKFFLEDDSSVIQKVYRVLRVPRK